MLLPLLGREFMPELEEGNLWIRGTVPLNTSLDAPHRDLDAGAGHHGHLSRSGIDRQPDRPARRRHRPDGYYNSEFFVPLRPENEWPKLVKQTGWRRICSARAAPHQGRNRHRDEPELEHKLPGINWNFSQNIRDNVMEALSGVKGDNSVKIVGPDLDKLENLAEKTKNILSSPRHRERRHFPHPRPVEPGVPRRPAEVPTVGRAAADVNNVVASAVGGKALSQMIEGEKRFDITLRWPQRLRAAKRPSSTFPWTSSTTRCVQSQGPGPNPSSTGTGLAAPSVKGSPVTTPPTQSAARPGCGCAIWSRRWTTTVRPIRTASSTARRLDDLPRTGTSG